MLKIDVSNFGDLLGISFVTPSVYVIFPKVVVEVEVWKPIRPEGTIWRCFNRFKRLRKNTLPSGYVKIAIENDHRNSGFSH